MRWTMPATRAPLHSQRASRVIAALTVIATTFAMHAMVRRASRQLKMPRPDAYAVATVWTSANSIAARSVVLQVH